MDNMNMVTEAKSQSDEQNLLAELEQLDVLEAKEFQEGVAFHAFRFASATSPEKL
jgi:hypothetical protein